VRCKLATSRTSKIVSDSAIPAPRHNAVLWICAVLSRREGESMLWSSVPQLRWHVARQVLASWFFLGSMIALFWYQPAIVRLAHAVLLGTGFVPTGYEQGALANYFAYGWWSLLIAWGSLEAGGFMMVWRYKARPDEYPEYQAQLRSLAEQAGVRPPTLIVLRGMGRILNAAATQSFLSGPKVIIIGSIVETLTPQETTYVSAHEVSHLKHVDVFPAVLIGAGNSAIAIQKWALLTSAAYDLFTHGWREAVFLILAWVVLSLTHMLYKLLAAAHSRTREYLADVGAVKLAGWDGRAALVVGLARIHHIASGWRPFKIFRPRDNWLFETHPGISDRADALKLNPRELPDGNVQIGDVVVAA
jgi:Zn-dependent protease with chaperone function